MTTDDEEISARIIAANQPLSTDPEERLAILKENVSEYTEEQKREDSKRLVRLDLAIAAQHLFATKILYRETPTWMNFWIESFLGRFESMARVFIGVVFGPGARSAIEAIYAKLEEDAAKKAARRMDAEAKVEIQALREAALQPSKKRKRHREIVSSRRAET